MGVAIVTAVDLANQAASASFRLSAEQVRGSTTHRLVGVDGGFDDSIYRDLYVTPGAPPMAPVIEARIRHADADTRLRLLGLDIFAEAAFRNVLGDTIRGQDALGDWLFEPMAVTLSRSAAAQLGVGAGDTLDIRHGGDPYRLQVHTLVDDDSLGSRDLLFVDIATAQVITRQPDRLSYIDLALDDDGIAWIRARMPVGVELVAVDDQTAATVALSASFELNLTAMSLLALLVGVFLIFNAMSFSIVQRRRLLGRLRAIGVSAAEIQRLILFEAIVLGLIGTLVGVVLGIALGSGLTRIVAATVSQLYYQVSVDALPVHMTSLAKAALLGVGGTLIASAWPAHTAAATPPLTTLSRAAIEQDARKHLPYLSALGLLLAFGGLIVAMQLPGGTATGFAGLFLTLVGSALLMPAALHLFHRVGRHLPLSGVLRMAVRDLDRHLSRLGTAAAALMIALAASVGVAVMVDSMRGAVDGWLHDLLTADLYIASAAFDEGAPLPSAVVERLPGLSDVDEYSSYRDTTVRLGGRPVTLIAARLAGQSRAGFDFVATRGIDPWPAFDSGHVLVSEPLAHRLRIAPGDPLTLPTPQGDIGLTVAAVFRDYANENGRLFLPRDSYDRYWHDDAVDTLALFSAGGAAALKDAIERVTGDDFALTYTVGGEIHQASMAVFDRTFRITEVLRLLSLLVAAIGVFSALMAIQLDRQHEYAVLRALGFRRLQLVQLILVESLVFGLVAGLVAVPTGLGMAWVLTDAIQLRAFGWTMPFQVQLPPLLLTVALGACAAVLAGLYPAWRSGWLQPAPQLRQD
jgi:putative ABC transport system permease protein